MPTKCFPALPVPVPGLLIWLTDAYWTIYGNICKKNVLTVTTYRLGVLSVSSFHFYYVFEHQNHRYNLPKYPESFLNVLDIHERIAFIFWSTKSTEKDVKYHTCFSIKAISMPQYINACQVLQQF